MDQHKSRIPNKLVTINPSSRTTVNDYPTIVRQTADRVRAYLVRIKEAITQERTDNLKQHFKERECPHIDYDSYAETFSYVYFLDNFWKAAAMFREDPPPLSRAVVDMGAGSGAISLAFLASLSATLGDQPWRIKMVLLDRSVRQLELAEHILRETTAFENLQIDLVFQKGELTDWRPLDGRVDCILLGHVLTENRTSTHAILKQLTDAVACQGKLYVIERTDDTVWEAIEEALAQVPVPRNDMISVVRLTDETTDLPAIRSQSEVASRYVALHMPEHLALLHVLDRYFRAWKERSIGLLRETFAQDAEYYEKPNRPPLRGIDEIEMYWVQRVLPQRDVDLKLGSVAYGHSYAIAEWQATFSLENSRLVLKGTLVMHVDCPSERATALREYYISEKWPTN